MPIRSVSPLLGVGDVDRSVAFYIRFGFRPTVQ